MAGAYKYRPQYTQNTVGGPVEKQPDAMIPGDTERAREVASKWLDELGLVPVSGAVDSLVGTIASALADARRETLEEAALLCDQFAQEHLAKFDEALDDTDGSSCVEDEEHGLYKAAEQLAADIRALAPQPEAPAQPKWLKCISCGLPEPSCTCGPTVTGNEQSISPRQKKGKG